MAKKSSNPADAFRKAQRAKELKKNKEQRKKVREVQTVKRDTRDLEAEIRSLKDKKDNASKSRIAELESELAYVLKTKEAYVKEHPEARDKVFGRPKGSGGRRAGDEDDAQAEDESGKGKGRERLYDEQGRLRDPTRSVYYDPVYNPWGVPPPGMPYQEKPGLDAEAQSDSDADSDENDSDEDIVMPEGPPPGDAPSGEEDSDDSDDIPLPPGPPPQKAAPPPPPSGPSAWGGRPAPVPIPFHQPPTMGAPIHMGMGMPYPPFPPPQQPGFLGQQPFYPPSGPSHQPHRVRPMRHNGPAMVQDPLSDEPTQTYQGYRMNKAEANLPPRPTTSFSAPIRPPPSDSTGPGTGAGEITAAPVLRDLRKETTVFVPRNLKKKGASSSLAGSGGSGGRINAAPGAGTIDEEGDEVVVRKTDGGLMGKLKGVLGSEVGSAVGGGGAKASADEDYERFLAGLGDIS